LVPDSDDKPELPARSFLLTFSPEGTTRESVHFPEKSYKSPEQERKKNVSCIFNQSDKRDKGLFAVEGEVRRKGDENSLLTQYDTQILLKRQKQEREKSSVAF